MVICKCKEVSLEIIGDEGPLCSILGGVPASRLGKHIGLETHPEAFLSDSPSDRES